MKKCLFGMVTVLTVIGLILSGCADPLVSDGFARSVSITAADKAAKVEIDPVPSPRSNASGVKITSNAHSADFPGIFFIWDSKQKDAGYLKVEEWIFDDYESFVLTAKMSNEYWDFPIAVQPGQDAVDGCYIFFIPKVIGKNINMVFLPEWVAAKGGDDEEDAEPVVVNLGFIGYYLYDGKVMSTSIHWQLLENEGDMIDWDAVDAAYADWMANGGLAPKRELWHTSGYASFTFDDCADIGYDDFNIGQLENYYKAYFVDSGYIIDEVVIQYSRYRAYVKLWNDIYGANGEDPEKSAICKILFDEGGIDHYNDLLKHFDAAFLPPYWYFDLDMGQVYDDWADWFEIGFYRIGLTEEFLAEKVVAAGFLAE